MNAMRLQWVRYSVVLAAAGAALSGCGTDGVLGPDESSASALVRAASDARAVDLGACVDLAAPAGSKLVFHAYAEGVQVYRWNGAAWVFAGPVAALYADAGGNGVVGSHFGGPTWKANSGGFIVGAVSKRCDVAPQDIPWLLLNVVRNEGPGVFSRVTHIQRLNTRGGQVPAVDGTQAGEVRNVPYTAEYFFYRAP